MTLSHLLTAFSLLHHFGELINGSPPLSHLLTAFSLLHHFGELINGSPLMFCAWYPLAGAALGCTKNTSNHGTGESVAQDRHSYAIICPRVDWAIAAGTRAL